MPSEVQHPFRRMESTCRYANTSLHLLSTGKSLLPSKLGGFLAGKFKTQEDMPSAGEGGRFDPNTWLGGVWTEMYVKDANFKAVRLLKEAAVRLSLCILT